MISSRTFKQGFLWKVRLIPIHQNFPFALQSWVNPHFHSQQKQVKQVPCGSAERSSTKLKTFPDNADINNDVIPLTLQSEIKQHQIISLIKGNC